MCDSSRRLLRCVVLLVVGAAMAGGCAAPSASRETAERVRLTAGLPGGGVIGFAEDLAEAYGEALPNLHVEAQPSAGALANVEALQTGNAEIGFTFANLAYASTLQPGQARQLRAIAVLQVSPAYLVVRPGSAIRDVADLKGHDVATGADGSGGAVAFELILGAYGLKATDLRITSLRNSDAAQRLLDGTLDALFVMGGFTTQTVRTALEGGAELRALRGPAIDRLRREYPFLRPAVVPRNTYPGVTDALRTIGIETLYVCRSDLSDDTVYGLTKVFFDALPTLARSQDILRFSDLDQAAAAPIPLHPGAARYYRERELLQ